MYQGGDVATNSSSGRDSESPNPKGSMAWTLVFICLPFLPRSEHWCVPGKLYCWIETCAHHACRFQIYEYALIEPEKIKIRTTLRQPPLLSTCRQMRQDAGLIWFERNKFLVTIWDCNAGLFAAFANLHHTHQGRYDTTGHLVYHVVLEGAKDWNNLARWCYAVWANAMPAYKMLEPSDEFEAFVSVVTNIAKIHRGRSWAECFATIDAVRYAVGKYDKAWVQPGDRLMGRG